MPHAAVRVAEGILCTICEAIWQTEPSRPPHPEGKRFVDRSILKSAIVGHWIRHPLEWIDPLALIDRPLRWIGRMLEGSPEWLPVASAVTLAITAFVTRMLR